MHYSPILAPVVALVAWSLVMMIWMFVTRFPAMREARHLAEGPGRQPRRPARRRGRGPGPVEGAQLQPSDGAADAVLRDLPDPRAARLRRRTNLWLAWAYVGLRIAHSLVQATVNVVRWRFLCSSPRPSACSASPSTPAPSSSIDMMQSGKIGVYARPARHRNGSRAFSLQVCNGNSACSRRRSSRVGLYEGKPEVLLRVSTSMFAMHFGRYRRALVDIFG